jgi:hypothetical protein
MRSGGEAVLLEVMSNLSVRFSFSRRQSQATLMDQAVDVVGSEPDAFHVERVDRATEGFAFLQESVAFLTRGLLLDNDDELGDAGEGGLAGIL